MPEVEKMYQNIGIGKEVMCEWTCKDNPYCNANCSYYGSTEEYYPPFTPEKQLGLIKVLAHCKGYTDYEHFGKYFNDYLKTLEFDEALANIVNDNWQDLTEQERTEIAEILRG